MRAIGIILILLLLCVSTAFADKLIIPFSVETDIFIDEMLKKGYVIDNFGEKKSKNSFGYVMNEGTQFLLYTYKEMQENDFNVVMDVVMEKKDGKNDGN